jgi:hypothetical protein
MHHYLFRFKTIFLVLIITFVNCAFVSVKTNDASTNSNSTTSLITRAEASRDVKKVSFLKRFIHRLSFKLQKANKGLIALVVVITILLSLVLAFGIYISAFGGGSGTLLAFIGIAGFALIIFGAARIIRGIKRKKGTAHLKLNTTAESGINDTVLPEI